MPDVVTSGPPFTRHLRHTPRKPWRPLQGLLKALRWLVDRLARPVVIGSLVVGCWALFVAYQLLTIYQPPVAGALLVWAFGFVCGLAWRDRRRKQLAVVSEWHDEEIGAIKLADTLADKGEMSGEHLVLGEPADGEAIEVEPWQHEGERAITERCACGAPGNVRRRDGVVECWRCCMAPVHPDYTAWPPGANVYRTGGFTAQGLQVITDRRAADSTGPVWVECRRCAGKGFFDAVPAEGLPWEQCPDCLQAGGHWGQQ